MSRLHLLETQLEVESALRRRAEAQVDRLMQCISDAVSAARVATASAMPAVPALADAPPKNQVDEPPLPPRILAYCRRYDDGSPRQFSVNVRVAREMLQAGRLEEEILRALIHGEQVESPL